MEAKIFSKVKSDVHIYIEKEHSMFDSTISAVFHDLKIKQLLSRANITKPCGINATNVVYDLFTVPEHRYLARWHTPHRKPGILLLHIAPLKAGLF